jgi:hypothetical protein
LPIIVVAAGKHNMRILILSFYFLLNASYAQKASISNIILWPDSLLSNNHNDSIKYPVVQIANSTVSNKINQTIRREILLDEDPKKGIKDALYQAASKWLITLEYEITYNNHGLLSITLIAEGMGAYPSTSYIYLNFDLSTGSQIKGADLIKSDKLDEFRKMVLSDKKDSLSEYLKEEQKMLKNNEIDSSDWESITDIVQNDCLNTIDIDKFRIKKDLLEVMDDCELPHFISGLGPTYHLRYPIKYLSNFLSPYIKMKLQFKN